MVKQISVFLENKSGRLAEVTEILAKNDIDIRALSIADTADFGILRLIVNNPEKAETILKEKGFAVKITDVLAINVDDTPGALAKVLKILNDAGLSVEYLYAFIGNAEKSALVMLRVEDNASALKVLLDNNVKIPTEDELNGL